MLPSPLRNCAKASLNATFALKDASLKFGPDVEIYMDESHLGTTVDCGVTVPIEESVNEWHNCTYRGRNVPEGMPWTMVKVSWPDFTWGIKQIWTCDDGDDGP
jgi:hypothetical protein